MFKGLKKSKEKKESGKKGSSPKDSKDHDHSEPSQNDYIIDPYAQSNSPPPVPERPAPSQPAGLLLDKAWRTLEWNKTKPIKDELRNLKISSPGVRNLRILVHGPVGAGKSSFINSIDSVFQGRMTTGSIAENATTGHSFTKIFQTFYIKNQSYEAFLPFAFCDIMGLEAGHREGVETEDLVKVLKGHIRDGYTFNPISSCSENHPSYNRNPNLSDRIHCLVSVISANHLSMMSDDVFSKMKELRAKAGGIPQVTVLTKVDEVCSRVAGDLKQVYMSRKIKDKMHECSNRLGIPMNCIFPVKCYHEEIQLNNNVDVLLLSALTTILHFANDHIAVMAASAPANMGGGRSPYVNTGGSPKGPPLPPKPR